MKKFTPTKRVKKRFFFKGDKIKYNGELYTVIEGYESAEPIHPYPILVEYYGGWSKFMSNSEKIETI